MNPALQRLLAQTVPTETRDDELIREVRALRDEVRELRRLRVDRSALPVDEAAELLGCGRSTVFEYLRSGRLQRARRTGRKAMVTRESVNAFADSAPIPTAPRSSSAVWEAERAKLLRPRGKPSPSPSSTRRGRGAADPRDAQGASGS